MELYTKKFIKKFRIKPLKGTEVLSFEVEQFAGMDTISRIKDGNENDLVAIMNIEEAIFVPEYIKGIIIASKTSLTDKEAKPFKDLNIPVFYSEYSKRELILTLDTYILKKTQKPERLHATMLSIFGMGVLIMGKSGIGKSEVALELINRGHLFVGDDAIDIISVAGIPIGKTPKISRDFIEVRGVGIVNVKSMFGIKSTIKEHQVDLVIELVHLDDVKISIERLGIEYQKQNIAYVDIPKIQVPISSGRAVAPVIESATITLKQRKSNNYIAADDLSDRFKHNL